MNHVFKLRSKLVGQHIHTTVFSGTKGQTLANYGELVMRLGEWRKFGVLLLLGSMSSDDLHTTTIIFEISEEIVTELARREEQDIKERVMTKDIEQLPDDIQDDIITYRDREWQELGEAFAELKQTIMDELPFARALLRICDKVDVCADKIQEALKKERGND